MSLNGLYEFNAYFLRYTSYLGEMTLSSSSLSSSISCLSPNLCWSAPFSFYSAIWKCFRDVSPKISEQLCFLPMLRMLMGSAATCRLLLGTAGALTSKKTEDSSNSLAIEMRSLLSSSGCCTRAAVAVGLPWSAGSGLSTSSWCSSGNF